MLGLGLEDGPHGLGHDAVEDGRDVSVATYIDGLVQPQLNLPMGIDHLYDGPAEELPLLWVGERDRLVRIHVLPDGPDKARNEKFLYYVCTYYIAFISYYSFAS